MIKLRLHSSTLLGELCLLVPQPFWVVYSQGLQGSQLGGAVGGVFGAWMSSGQFQPLPQIIMELPPCQKERLYDEVSNIISRLDWTDATELILIVMGNSSLKQMVAAALVKYVTQQLNAEVQYGD
ncbi:protein C19orf12 homolog [Ambystoma mexicanum]|uniref:protein C19orf12 homolog n=1 Tax=Ambystoma mexicanum TaxID=8296 RepID=UPI0037E87ABC